MSAELNVNQIGYGTIEAGETYEVYSWTTTTSQFNSARKRARFFTASPDPLIGGHLNATTDIQVEITRVWNILHETVDVNFKVSNVFQVNVAVLNSGGGTATFELIEAETNN